KNKKEICQRFAKLKEVQANTLSQCYCTTFNFAQSHPSPPTAPKIFDRNSTKNFGNRNLMAKFAKNWQLNILTLCRR
ncbi:MAG TPA: hypothetical protein PKY82_27465, partial [Pyrinomonadaceae bacterium]|nr:hypothetical protein [Pyrinomonadaceae bacterium]